MGLALLLSAVPAAAQVVIEERVEVRPDMVADTTEAEAQARGSWPGGVRGRGTFKMYFWGALLRIHPVSSLSATLTTTNGDTHALDLTGASETGFAEVCDPTDENADPSWVKCDQWTYGRGAVALETQLDHDENPGTLRLTGPGLDAEIPISISPITRYNKVDDYQLNCGYHYYAWGPYHASDCNCMRDWEGAIHGEISFYWEFEADPAELLLVTAPRDTLAFQGSPLDTGDLHVQAAYSDGAPAPLSDYASLTFTAESDYGSLAKWRCRYGCSIIERGSPLAKRYRKDPGDGIRFYADGNRGDDGPLVTEGPMCNDIVDIHVEGGGLTGSTQVVIRGQDPPPVMTSVFEVRTVPSALAVGDTALVFAEHRLEGESCGGGELIPDSTRMAVAAMPGIYGELLYNGERSTLFADVPFVDLKSGAVKLIADGEVPCEDDSMTVLVEGMHKGRRYRAHASVAIEGVNGEGRGVASCVSVDIPDFTETKQSILDWHEQNCSAQVAASGRTLSNFAELSYERDLALHLFGGMGWGRIDEYPRSHEDGVDGYLRWYTDENGNPTQFVSTIFESKLRETPPVADLPRDSSQAIEAIKFLGDQYDAWLGSPNAPVGSVGGPILIYGSQSAWDDLGRGEDWWIGYHEHVNNRIINVANERGVLILHTKVVHVPGTSYRYLKVKFVNEFSLLDTNIPGLSWLLRRASRFDVSRWTFHTMLPLSYDCDEVGDDGTNQDSPLPPF